MPAFAAVGVAALVIVTSSNVDVQGAFAIVHLNTFAPVLKPVTPEEGLLALANVPVPLTTVHVPAPIVAVLPANVAAVPHMF
jgi:hypothetical protein